jgi:hypothetical protein
VKIISTHWQDLLGLFAHSRVCVEVRVIKYSPRHFTDVSISQGFHWRVFSGKLPISDHGTTWVKAGIEIVPIIAHTSRIIPETGNHSSVIPFYLMILLFWELEPAFWVTCDIDFPSLRVFVFIQLRRAPLEPAQVYLSRFRRRILWDTVPFFEYGELLLCTVMWFLSPRNLRGTFLEGHDWRVSCHDIW